MLNYCKFLEVFSIHAFGKIKVINFAHSDCHSDKDCNRIDGLKIRAPNTNLYENYLNLVGGRFQLHVS